MPRCLMAKKWKAYPWAAEEKPVEENVLIKRSQSDDDEEDEEIDVVTIQQSSEIKPVPQYFTTQVLDNENVKVETSTAAQNYYQTSAEDYPSDEGRETIASSVIQQNNTHPVQHQQVRLTSVIHHSGSFLTQNNTGVQNNGSIHHSASPMQPQSTWAPSSPTEGATAPSPPPHIQHSSDSEITTIHYNGYTSDMSHYAAYLPGESATSPSYATLQTPSESRAPPPTPPRTRSLAMCFTSTGAALSLPPKKKDIYRPYSLEDRPSVRWRPAEDLSAAHAILDLSASPPAPLPQPPVVSSPLSSPPCPTSSSSMSSKSSCSSSSSTTSTSSAGSSSSKTIAYTYEAFFVSDGRSKKKPVTTTDNVTVITGANGEQRPKYTCSECGKQYATSSNLSRHKQTHRSLDSQSAKKCVTCGKAYVSMPALAMHLLTHKLNHACGICGKLFSRPWLLQGHLRSHTGEKPYGCAHCGKAFADRSNLRAHMQTHSTDKNFECTRCHKTFALKSYLNKHLESACIGETDCNTAINQVSTITHLR